PIYTRGNVGEAFPDVISPMSGSLMLEASTRSQTRFFLATGALSRAQVVDPRNAVFAQFGGYLYANVSMGRIAAVRAPGLSIDDLDAQYGGVGVLPPYTARRGDRDLLATVRLGRFASRGFRRRDAERARRARAEVDVWIASLSPVDRAANDELVERARRASHWFDRLLVEMMTVTLHAGSARVLIERLATRAGEADAPNAITSGLGDVASAGPAAALWELGRSVAGSTDLTAHFDRPIVDLLERLRADDACAAFVDAFESFLRTFGFHGADELELSSPKWGTDPTLALGIVERLRHAPADRAPEVAARRLARARVEAADRVASRLPGPSRLVFRLAVRNAALYARAREATKAALVRALYESRLALNELATRHGIARDDIYLVLEDELDLLEDGVDLTERIAKRGEQRATLRARRPPFWFEHELPDPSTWPLRFRSEPVAAEGATPSRLGGLGVSDGVATGRARIIVDPNDAHDLEPHEILVAPQTDPAWTPLFLAAAGVVVEHGAVMSHAAIVARELGIPAVVGVHSATTLIPTGANVTIDGSSGEVTVSR
ncbi:MAG TPA: PEP-utilizing enzyme, partial [Gemmatimonadaceae bacterium]|nr:PEP-utilizing enzyme [Gemmatimonadaceae bacterium]